MTVEPMKNADIIEATARGDLEAVKTYLLHGGSFEVELRENPRGLPYTSTLLHLAAKDGQMDILGFLLRHPRRPDVNAPDTRYHYTPLHAAAENGCDEALYMLLKHKADINKPNIFGQTPIFLSLYVHGKTDAQKTAFVKDLVENHGAKPSLVWSECGESILFAALRIGLMEVVEYLIDYGVNINQRNRTGATPLMSMIETFYADIEGKNQKEHKKNLAVYLLEHGADHDVHDQFLKTALHMAAEKGDAGIVESLALYGADINARDMWNRTPLFIASSDGLYNIVEILLRYGADPNIASSLKSHSTPLSAAQKVLNHKERDNITRLLLAHGARPEPRGTQKEGPSP